MPITGRFRHRKSPMVRLLLQVEEVRGGLAMVFAPKPRWRDAKVIDRAAAELRPLIDLSNRSRFLLGVQHGSLGDAVPVSSSTAEVRGSTIDTAPAEAPRAPLSAREAAAPT